jgi:hypothetical protein
MFEQQNFEFDGKILAVSDISLPVIDSTDALFANQRYGYFCSSQELAAETAKRTDITERSRC